MKHINTYGTGRLLLPAEELAMGQGTGVAPAKSPEAPTGLAALAAKTAKTQSARLHTLHDCFVSQDDETGDILIRIPQAVAFSAVHSSKTEKAVPMVTLMPKWADGRTGQIVLPILVKDGENEATFGLRIGAMNGFVTKG